MEEIERNLHEMPKVGPTVVERSAAMGAVVLRRPRGGELGRVELDDLAIGGSRLDVPRLELHNHGILENGQARDCQREALCVPTTAARGGGSLRRDGFLGALAGRATNAGSSCDLVLDHCRRGRCTYAVGRLFWGEREDEKESKCIQGGRDWRRTLGATGRSVHHTRSDHRSRKAITAATGAAIRAYTHTKVPGQQVKGYGKGEILGVELHRSRASCPSRDFGVASHNLGSGT